MKNIHQNTSLRIRKNQVKNYHYLIGYNLMKFRLSRQLNQVSPSYSVKKQSIHPIEYETKHLAKHYRAIIIKEVGEKGYDFIEHFIDTESRNTQLLFTSNNQLSEDDVYKDSVGLVRFNSIAKLDDFLEKLNKDLAVNGKFVGYVQTNKQRKENQWIRKVPVASSISAFGEFVFHRICPKLNGFKQLYFGITGGKQQRLSKAEVLGRLIKFGFKIIEFEDDIDGFMYFAVQKIKAPDLKAPGSNGFIYKFPRVGLNGKIIGVYKIRTMHPYSEYLQDYIVSTNGYAENGKPAKDFRIPAWARFVRRYWLDELPQLANVVKGDMKLFGVRPVTERYMQDIPEHIKKLRLSQKPGCIPAYVAFNEPSSKESVLQAEEHYLKLPKNGFIVDLKLILMAIKNIIFNKKRGA